MDYDALKSRLGANIAEYRRRAGLTQAELAEKLNYSDKAVSKWERGESVPDVLVLLQLAQELGMSLDDLIQAEPKPEPQVQIKTKKTVYRADRRIIQMLASLLVWFVALLVFVVLSSCGIGRSWVVFAYAIPVNAIVLLSLRSAWRRFSWNQALISAIIWGALFDFYITMLVFAQVNLWKVFLLGILGQAAVVLWFRMFKPVQEEQENGQV